MTDNYHHQPCYDLAARGRLGSVMYIVIWLLIMFVTPIWHDWPMLSAGFLALLTLAGLLRIYYSVKFEQLFQNNPLSCHLSPPTPPQKFHNLFGVSLQGKTTTLNSSIKFEAYKFDQGAKRGSSTLSIGNSTGCSPFHLLAYARAT